MVDNYDVWEAEDLRKERWRESRPVCCVCHEHIQDEELYDTTKGPMCWDCANGEARDRAEELYKELMSVWERTIREDGSW